MALAGAHLIEHSPYAWGGVGDMKFTEGGVLETPWGKGEWGLHPDDPSGMTVYADFVGAKHNVRFDLSTGMGVSTRCADSNVVLVRSIKAAKAKAKAAKEEVKDQEELKKAMDKKRSKRSSRKPRIRSEPKMLARRMGSMSRCKRHVQRHV